MWSELSEADAKAAAKRIMGVLFPELPQVSLDKYYTPYFVAVCIELGARSVEATAKVRFFQKLWESAMNPAKLRGLNMVKMIKLLTKAARAGVTAIAKGEIGILARSGIQYVYGHEIRTYFRMGGGEENHPSWPK